MPKREIPKEWWKIWGTYVKSYIIPYVKTHPLGLIQDGHQTYPWKICQNDLLSNGRKEVLEKMGKRTRKNNDVRTDKIATGIGKILDVSETTQGWRMVSGSFTEPFFTENMKYILELVPSQKKTKETVRRK